MVYTPCAKFKTSEMEIFQMICVNNDSRMPLYQQIYEQIKQEISNGTLKVGSRLMSTRSLAKNLCVARNTVENAYAQLCLEGYLLSKPGSGFVVQDIFSDSFDFIKSVDHTIQVKFDLRPSRIAQTEYLYDFQYANLDHMLFPSTLWRRLTAEALSSYDSQKICDYSDKQGNLNLRSEIMKYLRESRGVRCAPEQIVLCCGTQYALDVICSLFPDGSQIAVEEPGYDGAKIIFKKNKFKILPVSVGSDGINIEELESSPAKLVYITPSHQFPTGVVMPVQQRIELLDWAERRNGTIIEDDYDSELRYHTKPVPSLQSIDNHGSVIYMGTFSKSLSPGLRLSYLVLPEKLLRKYHEVYEGYYSTVPWLNQKITTLYMSRGHWDRHLRKVCLEYKKRHDVLVRTINDLMGNRVRIHGNNAGLHFILEFVQGESRKVMIEKAQKHGVRVYSTIQYWHGKEKSPDNCVFIGFSKMSENLIREGIVLLSKAWFDSEMGKTRDTPEWH